MHSHKIPRRSGFFVSFQDWLCVGIYLPHPSTDIGEAEIAGDLDGSDEDCSEDDGGPPGGAGPDVYVLEEPLHT